MGIHGGNIVLAKMIDGGSHRVVRVDAPSIPRRGGAYNCFCLQCGEPLLPKRGKILSWSFAHLSGSQCSGESVLHQAGKQVLLETCELLLPSYMFRIEREQWIEGKLFETKLSKWGDINNRSVTKFSKVELEKRFTISPGNYIVADAVAYLNDEVYCIVEFVVTHAIDEIKFAKLHQLGIPVLTIYLLTGMPLISSREDLGWDHSEIHRYLTAPRGSIGDDDGKRWAYHPGRAVLKKQLEAEEARQIEKFKADIFAQEERSRIEAQEARVRIEAEQKERAKKLEAERAERERERILKEKRIQREEQVARQNRERYERELAEEDRLRRAKRQRQLEEERLLKEAERQKILSEGSDRIWLRKHLDSLFLRCKNKVLVRRHGYIAEFPKDEKEDYRVTFYPGESKTQANLREILYIIRSSKKNEVVLKNPSEVLGEYSGDKPFSVEIDFSSVGQAVFNLVESCRVRGSKLHLAELSSIVFVR